MVMKRQAPRGRKHRQANAEQLQRKRSIERASSTLSNLVKEAQVLLGASPDDDQLKRHLQPVLANLRRAQSLHAELETVTDLKTPKDRAMKAALRAEQTRLDAESRTAWKALRAAQGELGLAVEVRKNKAIQEGCAQLASRAKSLTWQVLPPGGWKKFLSSPYARHVDQAAPQFCPERLAFLDTFGPQEWYAGSQLGHIVYMVAIFDKFAVADTPEWGNALFTRRVLAGIDDLDKATDGMLTHSENFQALNLLQARYREQVRCIYIDPPYNTGNDGFAHRDSYQHSSWLTMVEDRTVPAVSLLGPSGSLFVSVDQCEQPRLQLLLDTVIGADDRLATISVAKGTTTGQDAKAFGSSIDYLLGYRRSLAFELGGLTLSPSDLLRFNKEDERGRYSTLQLRKTGNNDRGEDRPNLYFPLEARNGTPTWPVGPGGYES